MQQPYQTTDIVTKREIARRVAVSPSDALRFCQTDRNTRKACQTLPVTDKAAICLTNDTMAKECDKVPMFSRQQFLNLIPPRIVIHTDDPNHFTYEFYSQNYKLSTEGFSSALRKAKIINTAVALLRPHVLAAYAMGPKSRFVNTLPPYVDASLIDAATAIHIKYTNYMRNNMDFDGVLQIGRNEDDTKVVVNQTIHLHLSKQPLNLEVPTDEQNPDLAEFTFIFNDEGLQESTFFVRSANKALVGEIKEQLESDKHLETLSIYGQGNIAPYNFTSLYAGLWDIDSFQISRIIYVLLNNGFHHARFSTTVDDAQVDEITPLQVTF